MNNRAKILDIAMNLNRLGNWAADDYNAKKGRISTFLTNTSSYLQNLDTTSLPKIFMGTFNTFLKEYRLLEKEAAKELKNPIFWAEDMITWGNILTHRSKLIQD
ncbi:MAG: hypothetical protein BWY24_00770 [Microgenomates group bacterium ADurb.Bin219]|nr:MAG: hypothetical protein BWY24_00770 [Microgenomates group bacterium ADurb.Bin219]HNP89230.1 hypothetical protein [Candidatus Woesebacteria bacterium]